MAGGVGSRFWPLSRISQPKQFIDILGTGETLIQQTFRRFKTICPKENIYIVTSDIYKEIVKSQIPELTDEQIICEPARRNTAPCIAYANYKIQKVNPNANIVVSPSDHIILREDIFVEVINNALEESSKSDCLITLGIQPSRPDTGYGYIQFNDKNSSDTSRKIKKVKTFTEKPVLEMAKSFIESGDFLWNAGIFVWSLKSIMKAFEQYLPDVDSIFKEGIPYYNSNGEEDFIKNAYSICKNISIDYGVMEKAHNVYVLAADFGWSDLGTWGSLYENRNKDANGNSIVGKNIMAYDTKNCIINFPKDKLAVIQGLEDFILVEDNNILLICKKSEEQQIRQFVNDVMSEKGDKYV